MPSHILCGVILFCGISSAWSKVQVPSDEARLRDWLLNSHNLSISPVDDLGRNLRVFFTLIVYRIQNLDERQGILSLETLVISVWENKDVAWNHWNFSNVVYTTLPPERVWKPDIDVINSVKPWKIISRDHLLVGEGGYFSWGVNVVLHTSCQPDLRYFPFDTHTCTIHLVGCTHQGNAVNATAQKAFIAGEDPLWVGNWMQSPRFRVVSNKAEYKPWKLSSDVNAMSVEFTVVIQRHAPLVALSTLTPAILSLFIALSSGFLRPTLSLRLALTAVCAFTSSIILIGLDQVVPGTSGRTPLLVEYCTSIQVATVLKFLFTIMASWLCDRKTAVPSWLQRIVLWVNSFRLPLDRLVSKCQRSVSLDEVILTSPTDESPEQTEVHTETSLAEGAPTWKAAVDALDRCFSLLLTAFTTFLVIAIMATV